MTKLARVYVDDFSSEVILEPNAHDSYKESVEVELTMNDKDLLEWSIYTNNWLLIIGLIFFLILCFIWTRIKKK